MTVPPTPVRIQLSRRKGFSLQAHSRTINGLPAINVARPGKWGNRWKIGDTVQCSSREKICETFAIETAAQAVDLFREDYEDLLADPGTGPVVRAALAELRGANLACWCRLPDPGQPDICDAGVWLEIANAKGWSE